MGGQAGERRDFAVLISFATKEEADVVVSLLHAEDIDAIVGNAHHATQQWGYVMAMNGIQVLVPRPRLADAKAAVRERLKAGAEMGREDYAARRDRWKLWAIVFGWAALMFAIPFLADALL